MYQVRCHPCNKFEAGTHVIFYPFSVPDLLPVGGQDPAVLLVMELVHLVSRGLHLHPVLDQQLLLPPLSLFEQVGGLPKALLLLLQ